MEALFALIAWWQMVAGEARGVNQTINKKPPEHSHHSQHGKGVLATEIGEPSRMVGCDFCREAKD